MTAQSGHGGARWTLLGTGILAVAFATGCPPTHGQAKLQMQTNGGGRVVSSPAGIDCGTTCYAYFSDWETIAITAIPDPGWAFTGWVSASACTGPSNPLSLFMRQDIACLARFDPVSPERLTVTIGGYGSGAVAGIGIACGTGGTDCAEDFPAGTVVTLLATPYPGSTLSGWTGCDSQPSPDRCTFTMSGPRNVVATFDDPDIFPVTLQVRTSPQGLVVSTDGLLSCTNDCSLVYRSGTSVTLVATPDYGWHLDFWLGCPTAVGVTCAFTIGSDRLVTAYFAPDLPTLLTVARIGTGSGAVYGDHVSCGATCTRRLGTGAVVVLSAVPDPGSYFREWTGDCAGIGIQTVLQMNGDRICTAVFHTGVGPPRNLVATGSGHSCVINAEGTVSCWGMGADLGNGAPGGSLLPVTVSGIPGGAGPSAVSLSAGGSHTCALLSDGSVVCWGANSNGQLGDGTTDRALVPVAAQGVSNAASVGTGPLHTCAVLGDGTAKCWGDNRRGALGRGFLSGAEPVPAQVMVDASTPLGGAVTASGSILHTCAITSGGAVKCWGSDAWGELGYGGPSQVRPFADTGAATTPGPIGLAAGGLVSGTTCALFPSGSAECWGYGESGQIGDGTGRSSSLPRTVRSLAGAVGGTLGAEHVCAMMSAGAVQCWGKALVGQVGDDQIANRWAPDGVYGLSTAIAVGSGPGSNHSCAVLRDRTVWCWGYAHQGQLGDLVFGPGQYEKVPTQVMGL
jgi:alpha-tubulin suppressor-like RCC1 family protein